MATANRPRTDQRDPLLTVDQAAAHAGLKPATIRAWVWRRTIPVYRVGTKAVRIRRSDIDAIINAGFVPAADSRVA